MGVTNLVEQIDAELQSLETRATALRNARNALATDNVVAPASSPAPNRSRGRGRPRGGGNRSQQALSLVTGKPGISIPEIAKEMGIGANYLYRVLPKLAGEGKVTRDGQGWFPAS